MSLIGGLADRLGGPARARVVVVLGAVLALNGADSGAVAAAATALKRSLHLDNTQIGLLVTASALVGAAATLPVGALADRLNRTRLMAASVLTWAVAIAASGAAPTFMLLLVARLLLGAVTATAGPVVASLTGDFFPVGDRARMYGLVLAGELIGSGAGFLVSGYLTAELGWRWAFWWLVVPSLLAALALYRLPEPARGGAGQLQDGQDHIAEQEVGEQELARQERDVLEAVRQDPFHRMLRQRGLRPAPDLVLHRDPRRMSLWEASRYALRIRTLALLVVSSALANAYFTGLRTFALVFAEDQYGLGQSAATTLILPIGLGALAGVLLGGRLADRLLAGARPAARVLVTGVLLLAVAPVLAPAFLLTDAWLALPLLVVGAGLLGASNPPQDAARLDVVPPLLWGRSEGIRSTLRQLLEGAAPLAFGLVADRVFGGRASATGRAMAAGPPAIGRTLLVFLVALVVAGLVVLLALRSYPEDVVTADASMAAGLSGPARSRG